MDASQAINNLIIHPFQSPAPSGKQPGLIEGLELKNRYLITRTTLNKIVIIGFMVLIGFSLAKAIYHGSFMGITLALVALGASVYFLYILVKAKEESETRETTL